MKNILYYGLTQRNPPELAKGAPIRATCEDAIFELDRTQLSGLDGSGWRFIVERIENEKGGCGRVLKKPTTAPKESQVCMHRYI